MTNVKYLCFFGVSVVVASAFAGGCGDAAVSGEGPGDDDDSGVVGPGVDAGKKDSGTHPKDAGSQKDTSVPPGDDDADPPPDGSSGVDAPTTSLPPWTDIPPPNNAVSVRVRNGCSFPLWIHGAGDSATLMPDNAELTPGAEHDYVAPTSWSAARVTAFVDGPGQGELEKAEITLSGGTLNYNVTYVDWVGLPLEIIGVGGNCTAAADTTGCYAKESGILTGCPEPFLLQGKKCVAARSYCLDPTHQGAAYCHALDNEITACPTCPKAQTPDVYACAGAYQSDPRMCAAVNRGMIADPDNANGALYYKNGPFNTYSKWVHSFCPNIYAFPYDDWKAQGGFRSCSGNELRITFCPSG